MAEKNVFERKAGGRIHAYQIKKVAYGRYFVDKNGREHWPMSSWWSEKFRPMKHGDDGIYFVDCDSDDEGWMTKDALYAKFSTVSDEAGALKVRMDDATERAVDLEKSLAIVADIPELASVMVMEARANRVIASAIEQRIALSNCAKSDPNGYVNLRVAPTVRWNN